MITSNQRVLLASRLCWVLAVLLVHATARAEPETAEPETAEPGEGSLADIPEETWDEEPPQPAPQEPIARRGFVVLPFVGLFVAGSGTTTAELDCQVGDCDSQSVERDLSQNENFLLGIDGLYHVLPELRLGLGLTWVPTVAVQIDGGSSSTEFGSELAPMALVEGIFGDRTAGAIRGFIGPNFLFPDGDTQDLIDIMDSACSGIAASGGSCDVADGPYTGLTFGAAAALVAPVSDTAALRAELAVQRIAFSGPSLAVSDTSGNRYEDRLGWSTTRLSFRFGFEFLTGGST